MELIGGETWGSDGGRERHKGKPAQKDNFYDCVSLFDLRRRGRDFGQSLF